MAEDSSYCVQQLPTEILVKIFNYLPAVKLMQFRQICTRWRDIINSMLNESLWLQYCIEDYKLMFASIRHRIKPGVSFFDLYKSFSLWPKISKAKVVHEEFASACRVSEEVRGFLLLPNNTIAVRNHMGISYYDLQTFNKTNQEPVRGAFVGYVENRDVILLHGVELHLFVGMKVIYNKDQESNVTFHLVTHYLLTDDEIYYVRNSKDLFICKYRESLSSTYVGKVVDDFVYCLGYKDNMLYLATINKSIFKFNGKHITLECSLDNSSNVLHTLNMYNLLEHFYFHAYTEWMYTLNHQIPSGPLQDMLVIHIYGDVVFVGTKWGVFQIYYKPYINGIFDIYNSEPVKQFNFMEPDSCPVLSYSPITCIDVVEGVNEHIVYVGMPKKIAVIKFIHEFNKTSLATSAVTSYLLSNKDTFTIST